MIHVPCSVCESIQKRFIPFSYETKPRPFTDSWWQARCRVSEMASWCLSVEREWMASLLFFILHLITFNYTKYGHDNNAKWLYPNVWPVNAITKEKISSRVPNSHFFFFLSQTCIYIILHLSVVHWVEDIRRIQRYIQIYVNTHRVT